MNCIYIQIMLVDEAFPLALGLVRKERPSVILIELKKVLAGKKFISSDVLDALDEKALSLKDIDTVSFKTAMNCI